MSEGEECSAPDFVAVLGNERLGLDGLGRDIGDRLVESRHVVDERDVKR